MLVVAASCGLLAWVLLLTMRPADRIGVAAALAVPLLYVPHLPLPLGQLWLLMVGTVGLLDRRTRTHPSPALVLVCALALITALSELWSPAGGALQQALRFGLFGLALHLAQSTLTEGVGVLDRTLRLMTPWMLLQAGLVFLFRSAPAVEDRFLHSRAADLLLGPAADALFTTGQNNVLDPAKSGGLFVNANVASLFAGLCFFAVAVLRVRTGQTRHTVLLVVLWLSVFATGSKTGAALAIALPVLAFLVVRLRSWPSSPYFLGFGLLTLPITLSVGDAVLRSVVPDYATRSTESLGTRTLLWSAAWDLFQQSPVYGLGFGGWQREIGAYVGRDDYPPHNLLIDAWAKSGIVCAAVTAALVLVVGARYLRLAFRDDLDPDLRRLNAYGLAAWTWLVVHGMGDNTSVFGDLHSMLLVAVLLAYQQWVRTQATAAAAATVAATPAADAGTGPAPLRLVGAAT
jgi:O-antigen ligase